MSNTKSRISDINLCRNLWNRVRGITLGLDERVTDLEDSAQENVIEAVSFNGTDVPPDADKRVSLTEQDPTVPAWAKSINKPSYTPEEIGAVSSASGSHTVPISWSLKKMLSNYGATINYDCFVAAAGDKELKLRVSRYQDRIEIALINQNNTVELGLYQMLNTSECGYLVSGYRFRKAINLGDENGLLPITIQQGGTGGTTPAEARTNLEITPANIGAVSTSDVINVAHGGTGATTAALIVTNQYVSIEEAINDVRGSRVFPISLQKNGSRYYGDMPTGYETVEWNMELVGDGTRLTAFLFLFDNTGVYRRDFYNGSWRTGWTKIAQITPADIGAVSTSDVINVAHGGTGATTAAVSITNNYSSVLNTINAVKGTRIFPISIQKNGTSSYSDMPSGYETTEWNMLLIGDAMRMTALLFIHFNASPNNQVFSRNFYNGSWLTAWSQIK